MPVENMSSELTRSLFRLTRPSFAEFVHSGTPFFSGADKRMINFEPVVHYLNRGSSVQLSDRNWRTVTNDAEDFGVDELSSAAGLK
jgi:hypothetical protein